MFATQSCAAHNEQPLEYAQARLLGQHGIKSQFVDQAKETLTQGETVPTSSRFSM